jgi:imidazolonepropionase-like amidohydrolase
MMRAVVAGVVLAFGCSARSPAPPEPVQAPAEVKPAARAEEPAGHFVIRGATVVGVGPADVEVRDGKIAAIGATANAASEVAAAGQWVVPACIDSHVHLSYLPVGRRVLAGGVAAVVDLAAPIEALTRPDSPPELLVWRSGPMITARGGYPTQDWGSDGYGLEVDGAEAAARAVDTLADAGAKLIKVPVTEARALEPKALRAIVERAHARGLKVAAHALLDRQAKIAADEGVDVLAHAPVEPLREATVAAWSGRAVISTLDAFGGSREAVENLRRLRAAGATVLYGTDLGNTRSPGIDAEELGLLVEAGFDGRAIVAAMTLVPRDYWGMSGGPGSLTVGGPASFIIVPRDPLVEPMALAEPTAVYVAGVRQPE